MIDVSAVGDGSLVVVASVLIVREVLSWVDKKKNGPRNHRLGRAVEIITAQSEGGTPLVYRHPDTQELLVALTSSATTQTAILRDMQKAIDRIECAR